MFKKKPQIKNLSPLRSSDRRKLADRMIADYHIQIPSPSAGTDNPEADISQQLESGTAGTAPSLTSVRASLLPESCLSARFTTHAGASATLVSGTVYVGAHPGQDERILWIQYGKDSRLYPSVYTLWQNPGIIPLLHTQDFVAEKLRSGADLMTPGLVGSPPWPEAAKEGAVVGVAGLSKDSVPIWVGVCKIDISSLGRVQGMKGAAVEGIHWEGDEIWNWSQAGVGGRVAPDQIEGWELFEKRVREGIDGLDLDDEDDREEAQAEGGVRLEPQSLPDLANGNGTVDHAREPSGDDEEDEQREPSTEEIDDAFYKAFLYAIYNAKKNNRPPHYGLDFPIQPSLLISNMIQPHLRFQNQNYSIKKTSWKNAKKFIKFLDKKQIVKSKDRNGGETVILDIDFDDQQIKDFKPYRLPKTKAADDPSSSTTGATTSNGITDTSIGQKLTLLTVYRASAKLVPDLVPSKSQYYSSTQISNYLKTYIENHPDLSTGVSSKRYIKLDPFIANNILNSNLSASDTKILAAGEIARDVLLKRVIDDDHLCIPHWILLKDSPSSSSSSTTTAATTTTPSDLDFTRHKPRVGAPPTVNMVLEKRTGTKVVTKLSNLEAFNINPQILAPELQRKCAGSASVAQLVGGKPGMLEITVQGDQRDVVEKELGRRGVRVGGSNGWVSVVDKVNKKKG